MQKKPNPIQANIVLYCLLIIVLPLFSACTKPVEKPLNIATNIWPGYEPLYLARSMDYFDKKDIRLVEFVSSTQGMRSLIDGTVEAAALTLDETLFLKQQGMDVQIILIMDYSAGADGLVAKPGINNLEGIRNKKIGVETTALGAYMMQRILEKAGLKLKDVKVVPMELSEHEPGFLNGSVDAVVTFEPYLSRLEKRGAIRLLDSKQLPGEIVDVLVIRSDAIKLYNKQLKKLLTAWFKALAYIKTNKAQAARLMSTRLKLDVPGVIGALDGVKFPDFKENQKLLVGESPLLAKQADKLSKVMLNRKLISNTVNSRELFDTNILHTLYP